jgi:hypothetical protein
MKRELLIAAVVIAAFVFPARVVPSTIYAYTAARRQGL